MNTPKMPCLVQAGHLFIITYSGSLFCGSSGACHLSNFMSVQAPLRANAVHRRDGSVDSNS
ncbi:hypothetical protein [Bacillus sp. N1-1]|uniref:hypothetical protein n=1 Tax=Bacillus sp. N1-1 TaxID=2682541 RepID=UPI001315EF43|nr:hypothetical protein [Bacillus sp. N1-1]QHA91199.1 hypothetical protein GNK04_07070 [Bacillus sp. N1-1]